MSTEHFGAMPIFTAKLQQLFHPNIIIDNFPIKLYIRYPIQNNFRGISEDEAPSS